MIHLNNQPFLLSLRQAEKHTDAHQEYETMLQEQHADFKEYVQECFNSETPAPKRFLFLGRADNELCSIHQKYADIIKEANAKLYHIWATMIDDTRRFIAVGIDTLHFQAKCPAYMLADNTSQKFPALKWTGSRNDLTEAMVGVYQSDTIRLQDGSRPSFALFAKSIGNLFGVPYNYPHDDLRRLLSRKKNPTPFLNRMIEIIKSKNADTDT